MRICRIGVSLAILGLLIMGILAIPAAAASPPEPTYGSAVVDGDYREWDLESDFFANMYRAAKPDKPVESKLYLRYDCDDEVLYALVLAVDNVTVLEMPDDAFIKLGMNKKLVDGNYGDDGTPPDFAWVYDDGELVGWEASTPLAQGIYSNLNVHTQVWSGGKAQTSAVANRAIPLSIACGQMELRGSIGDTIWLDKNGNGDQDAGEPGIEGVVVQLWKYGKDGDVFVGETETDGNGLYEFTGLSTGCYTVIVVKENFEPGEALYGLVPTYDYDGGRDNRAEVCLDEPGQHFLDADFGYRSEEPPPVPGVTLWGAIGALLALAAAAILVLTGRTPAFGKN